VLRRYKAGQHNFARARLIDADLSGANLGGASFRDADLRGAILVGTNLDGAILCGVNLSDVILQHSDLVGASLVDANLRGADLNGADLRGANLCDADLRGADLAGANLSSANLRGANLRGADGYAADLGNANLSSTDLSDATLVCTNLGDARLVGADLGWANLSDGNLGGANLSGAFLAGANLAGTNLREAKLSGAELGGTLLVDTDLSPLCDADPPVLHHGPSTVDLRSVIKSLRCPNLRDFLVRTGLPERVVEEMVDSAMALGRDIMSSTFISYGHKDESFARKLYEELHRSGVRVFYAPEHATPGEKLHRELRRGIEKHDRMILVCSRASLDRPWVLYEIETAIEREARDGGASYLIPIALDGYVFKGWNPKRPDLATAVRARVVGDFEGADRDAKKFSRSLRQLLGALRKTPGRLAGMET
jgi:uncharacterized protein YjbI with pentapeptide repeats